MHSADSERTNSFVIDSLRKSTKIVFENFADMLLSIPDIFNGLKFDSDNRQKSFTDT